MGAMHGSSTLVPLWGVRLTPMGRLLALLRSRGHVVQLFCSVDDSDASFQVQRMVEVFGYAKDRKSVV